MPKIRWGGVRRDLEGERARYEFEFQHLESLINEGRMRIVYFVGFVGGKIYRFFSSMRFLLLYFFAKSIGV